MMNPTPSHQYILEIDDSERLILPSVICEQLNLHTGDRLSLNLQPDGSLQIINLRPQVEKFKGIYKDIADGVSLADELIQERRKEAQTEN